MAKINISFPYDTHRENEWALIDDNFMCMNGGLGLFTPAVLMRGGRSYVAIVRNYDKNTPVEDLKWEAFAICDSGVGWQYFNDSEREFIEGWTKHPTWRAAVRMLARSRLSILMHRLHSAAGMVCADIDSEKLSDGVKDALAFFVERFRHAEEFASNVQVDDFKYVLRYLNNLSSLNEYELNNIHSEVVGDDYERLVDLQLQMIDVENSAQWTV